MNKQKFLAELGKLLTFMYEEDRQTALTMYAKMFDNAADEQALIQLLNSPTRQAVVIARAYNAKERKLQVSAQPRDELYGEQDGTPDYIAAISRLESEAVSKRIIAPEVPTEQFTLFDDGIHPVEDEPEADAAAPEAEKDAPDAAETARENAAEQEQPAPEDGNEPDDGSVQPSQSGEHEAQQAESLELDGDDVDAFLSDFSIANDDFAEKAGAKAAPEDKVVRVRPDDDEPEFAPYTAQERPAYNAPDNAAPRQRAQADSMELTERRPVVPLLILYILAAVPIVAACVLLLLIPTLFFLAMAIGAVVLGCMALSSAFGAFTIFADVMVVLGAALVILALGLLFLWIFVWFVGGAIAGLINAIIKLGGKWCYREVSAA